MTKYYKVLVDGWSCHGGTMQWSLPADGVPGEWHEVTGPLVMCQNGLHVTSEPARWWSPDASLYLVEIDGETVSDGGDKIAARKVRLVARVAGADLELAGILASGEHRVASGYWWAYGSATVRAYDSATVRAYDSATVEAYGSATVEASDSATVRAYDSATVEAYDSATVEAYGSATVEAYDSATVEAYDSATVRASDSATVISTRWHGGEAIIALVDEAAHVDRRVGWC